MKGRSVLVLVQARTSSTRLPGKVLLPVGGIPLAILAAKRAARDGLPTRLATSVDPSDDELARLAAREGIDVFRGALDDPLARFVAASADLGGGALVVRLTADNPFPDAEFVRGLVEECTRRGLRYLRASTESGLAYGLSAEVFDVDALREAGREARDPYDREHVTPFLRRRVGDAIAARDPSLAPCPHLRATIDTFDDYQRALRVFSGVDDPVGVSYRALVERLAALPDAPAHAIPRAAREPGLARLVLGTAQLGLPYGVANESGMPAEAEAHAIVTSAFEHGVTHVDTARAYGEAEARLGRALSRLGASSLAVITKLRPLDDGLARSPREWALEAERSLLESLVALGRRSVDVLLFHRAGDLDLGEGVVLARLLELRAEGRVGALGVSVQSPVEALRALERPELTHVQLPLNLLDHRFEAVAEARLARPDVTIVARSALLQGLLSGRVPPARFPRAGAVDPASLLATLGALVRELGREDLVDLALAYVRGEPWVDAVVLGIERVDQLRDAARRFSTPPLDAAARARVREALPRCPDELLDPSRWTFDDPPDGP